MDRAHLLTSLLWILLRNRIWWSELFAFLNIPNQLISLQGALLIKGTSGFLAFLSLIHHIRVRDFVGLFGCHNLCPTLVESSRSARRGRGRVLSQISKCMVITKLLDFGASILLRVGLLSVYCQAGFDSPKEITTLLGLMFSTQVFTSILAPILGAVVVWYVPR